MAGWSNFSEKPHVYREDAGRHVSLGCLLNDGMLQATPFPDCISGHAACLSPSPSWRAPAPLLIAVCSWDRIGCQRQHLQDDCRRLHPGSAAAATVLSLRIGSGPVTSDGRNGEWDRTVCPTGSLPSSPPFFILPRSFRRWCCAVWVAHNTCVLLWVSATRGKTVGRLESNLRPVSREESRREEWV